ncbi:hypothetical protein SDC9_156616 [bioreactor metagenome]|uniref:Uncharacterized protein n=1 Tax=bioreactor metagenome TaxID=1076179 RepID=A0A645F560_9ZZZZ
MEIDNADAWARRETAFEGVKGWLVGAAEKEQGTFKLDIRCGFFMYRGSGLLGNSEVFMDRQRCADNLPDGGSSGFKVHG